MANLDYEDVLGGLDEATPTDGRFPFLEQETTFLLEVVETKLFPSSKDDSIIWLQEVKVVESDNETVKPGVMRTTMIHDLKGKYKKMRLGDLKRQIAALMGYNAESDQKWVQIGSQIADKNACKGFRLVAKTGKPKAGSDFVPVTFSTPELDRCGDRQRAMIEKRKGN